MSRTLENCENSTLGRILPGRINLQNRCSNEAWFVGSLASHASWVYPMSEQMLFPPETGRKRESHATEMALVRLTYFVWLCWQGWVKTAHHLPTPSETMDLLRTKRFSPNHLAEFECRNVCLRFKRMANSSVSARSRHFQSGLYSTSQPFNPLSPLRSMHTDRPAWRLI